MGKKRWTIPAAAALLLLSACSCAGDEDDKTAPTTQPQEPQVEAAYLAFWDMFTRLAHDPNPADPELAQRASGEALTNLVNGLTSLAAQGQRSEFGPRYSHDVRSVELKGDGTAVVTDCAVDDSRIVDSATGAVVNEGTVTELTETTLVLVNGTWQVNETNPIEAWPGEEKCD